MKQAATIRGLGGADDLAAYFGIKDTPRWCTVGRRHRDKGREISRIRRKLGLTQAAAGELIGGGPRAFQKYESGDLVPNRAISSALVLLDHDPRSPEMRRAPRVAVRGFADASAAQALGKPASSRRCAARRPLCFARGDYIRAMVIRSCRTEWTNIVLVCGKCARKLDGGYGAKGKDSLRSCLRKSLKKAGRRREVRIAETRCMGICPKGGTTVVSASRPGVAFVVPVGTPVAEALGLVIEPAD